MAITYTPIPERQGYDATVTPQWQMLPVGRQRYLRVAGSAGLMPRIRVPHGSSASLSAVSSGMEPSLLLVLTGRRAGQAYVEWVTPGASESDPFAEGLLSICVKEERVVKAAFHYVEAGLLQKTRRRIEDLDAMIDRANKILRPQANVSLLRKHAAPLRIHERLGYIVRSTIDLGDTAPRDEWAVVTAYADTSADVNIFFVRRFEADDTPRVDRTDAAARWWTGACLIEDETAHDVAEVLAHEMMHLLGLGHSTKAAHITAPGYMRTGTTITRDQANKINRSGT